LDENQVFLASNYETLKTYSLNIFASSITIMILFSFLVTLFLGKTISAKEEILTQFLEINEKTSKYLYSKCENFLL